MDKELQWAVYEYLRDRLSVSVRVVQQTPCGGDAGVEVALSLLSPDGEWVVVARDFGS